MTQCFSVSAEVVCGEPSQMPYCSQKTADIMGHACK